MRRSLIAILLLSGCATAPLPRLLDRYESYGFKGAVVVAHGDRIVEARHADVAFNIGSVTKTFTAAAILKLDRERKLSIYDPLSRFVANVPPDKQPITIKQLLSHTSGLVPNMSNANVPAGANRDEMLVRVLATPLLHPPGTKARYSNVGFAVLAAIIEIVSGRDYREYIRAEVIAPAGLKRTGFAEDKLWRDDEIARGIAEPDDEVNGPQLPAPRSWSTHLGAGGIVSTARDLHRWLQTPRDPRMAIVVKDDYGLGWFVSRTSLGRSIVWHDGHVPGFRANVTAYKDSDLRVVFLINDERVKLPIGDAVERIMFNEPILIPPRRGAAPPIDPARMIGDREDGIRIWMDNGVLYAGALEQRGMDRLLNGGRAIPGSSEANERATRLLERLERGESDKADLLTWWRGPCADRSHARVAGTVPRSTSALQTFIELPCGSENKVVRIVWKGDQPAAWGGGVPRAGITPLRQYDATTFIGFENMLATEPVYFRATR